MDNVRTIHFAQYNATNVHPLAIVFMICMSALAFAPKRSAAVFAALAVCVFMPMEKRVVIAGLDFSMFRLILVVAWTRVLVRGEHRGFRLDRLDRYVLLWVLSASLFYVLRMGPSGIVYRLGVGLDVLGAFFLVRTLVKTRSEVFAFWKNLARIVMVLSPFFLYEMTALKNVFGMFTYDGFDQVYIRDERARAQGPFSHPILAGTFSSSLVPAFFAILLGRKSERKFFALACVAATVITVASGSSGPVVAWAVGAFGWGIWRFRRHMRTMLRFALLMGVVVHFVRDKPVWHLISRLSSITGGTGDHRYRLIDAFIRRFDEWALMGTGGTAYWGWGLQDTTNQYVLEGIKGGLLTLIFFVLILRTGFVELKASRGLFERLEGPKSMWALLAWGSSVSLAAHCVSFMSVAYFGRMLQFFLLFVATVPAFARFKRRKRATARAPSTPARAPLPVTRFPSAAQSSVGPKPP